MKMDDSVRKAYLPVPAACSKNSQAVRIAPSPDNIPRTTTPRTTTLPKEGASQPSPSHPSAVAIASADAAAALAAASAADTASGSIPSRSKPAAFSMGVYVGAGMIVTYGGIRVKRKMYSVNGMSEISSRVVRGRDELRCGTVVDVDDSGEQWSGARDVSRGKNAHPLSDKSGGDIGPVGRKGGSCQGECVRIPRS